MEGTLYITIRNWYYAPSGQGAFPRVGTALAALRGPNMMSLLLRAGLAVAACLLVLHLLGLAPPGKGPRARRP